MSKLIILQGCPCSGKSTWAQEYKKTHTVIVVNKDSIRNELRIKTGDFSREDEVEQIEKERAAAAITQNLDVIVDDTNLNPNTIKGWEIFAKRFNCEIEYKEFYVPFEEAMRRSKTRKELGGMYISKKVMLGFYKKYFPDRFKEEHTDHRIILQPRYDLPDCVICDLDATLALHQGREPFDWDKIDTDKSDPRLVRILNMYMELLNVKVLFVTGRPDKARQATLAWLKKWENTLYPNYELFTRNDNDFSAGNIYKRNVYENHIKNKYNVLCVFEDSNKCVDMWRELGLLTCQVENSDY